MSIVIRPDIIEVVISHSGGLVHCSSFFVICDSMLTSKNYDQRTKTWFFMLEPNDPFGSAQGNY